MSLRAIPAPLWFVAALVPMVVSQIVRLEQSDPATWIAWDYAGRIGALAVLGAIPSARTLAFSGSDFASRIGKPPVGLSASSSLTIMYVAGYGAPLIRCYRQRYSGAILKRTA